MPVEGATRAPIIAAGIGSYWFDSGGEWTVRGGGLARLCQARGR